MKLGYWAFCAAIISHTSILPLLAENNIMGTSTPNTQDTLVKSSPAKAGTIDVPAQEASESDVMAQKADKKARWKKRMQERAKRRADRKAKEEAEQADIKNEQKESEKDLSTKKV